MDLFHPVQKVVSIDEVLELILEYVASREPWESSSHLRLVSKRWRSLSFRGLCQSSQLPTIRIRNLNYESDDMAEISFRFFKKNFPARRPREMTLTNPMLPIALRLGRYPKPKEISLLQESASHIAAITVERPESIRRGDVFGKHLAGRQMDFLAQLPNLRYVSIIWDYNVFTHPGFTEIVDVLRRCPKRLTHVDYKYENLNMGMEMTRRNAEDLPSPPSNLTHISYVGCVADLQKLISGTVNNLSGIQLVVREDKMMFDYAILNEVIGNHRKSLRELNISGPSPRGAVELYEMQFLKTLSTNVPVHYREGESSSVRSFNLTRLEYTINHWPENAAAALETIRLSSSSLQHLTLNWTYSSSRLLNWTNWTTECESHKNSAGEKLCEEAFLEASEQGIPLCSQLTELKLFKFPFRVGFALMPRGYQLMANITRLNLYFKKMKKQEL